MSSSTDAAGAGTSEPKAPATGAPGRPSRSFSAEVVAAVCRHMNDDHADDSLLICRTLGGRPTATAARAVGVDGEGMQFEVEMDGESRRTAVRFGAPVSERAQIRLAVVELYELACAAAGIAARDTGH